MPESLDQPSDLEIEKTEPDLTAEPTLAAEPNRTMIGSWTVDRYVQFTRWTVVLTALVGGVFLYIGLSQTAVIGIELAAAIWLGWRVGGRNGQTAEALTTGVIAGFGFGGLLAAVRLLLERSTPAAVNLLVEPVVTAVSAALVCLIVLLIRKLTKT